MTPTEYWCGQCRSLYDHRLEACPACGTRNKPEDITGINIAAPPGSDGAVYGPPKTPRIPGYCPKCGTRTPVLPPVDVTDHMVAHCEACNIRYNDTTGEILE